MLFRMFSAKIKRGALIIFYWMVTSFVLLEAGTRIYLGLLAPESEYKKYASHEQLRHAAKVNNSLRLVPSAYLPWIPAPNFRDGEDRHNAQGFRGMELPPVKPVNEFWIACIGGSTTYDDNIDSWSDAYPAKLESILRARNLNVRVINAGIPLASSYESLISYSLRVSSLKPDLVISLDLANDVAMRLVWPPEGYRSDNSGIVGNTFDVPQERLYEKSAFVRYLLTYSGLRQSSEHRYLFIPAPTCLVTRPWSDSNGSPTLAGQLPPLTMRDVFDANPPVYYENNLRHLAALVRNDGADLVFCTCPTSKPEVGELSSAENEVVKEIHSMNKRLREIGGAISVPVIDLEASMPETKSLWADSIHNTSDGAAIKAQQIADYLLRSMLLEGAVDLQIQ